MEICCEKDQGLLVSGECDRFSISAKFIICVQMCGVLIFCGGGDRMGDEGVGCLCQFVDGCSRRLTTLSGNSVGVLSACGIRAKNFCI